MISVVRKMNFPVAEVVIQDVLNDARENIVTGTAGLAAFAVLALGKLAAENGLWSDLTRLCSRG